MSHLRLSLVRAALLAGLAAIAWTGCSPDPGTPEYVLEKLKQGNVVGGENLGRLGSEHVPALRALLADLNTPRISRLQALERLCEIQAPAEPGALTEFLNDPDPEVRMRIARQVSEAGSAESALLLVERFEREDEDLVRSVLMRGLQVVGSGIASPPDAVIDRIVAGMQAADGPRRIDWIRALGGWHGEKVEGLLIAALGDADPRLAVAAARSLRGPAVRSIERLGPIYVSLLASPSPEIRLAGIEALEAASHPNRVSGPSECAEKPVLKLIDAVPELPQAVEALLGDARITGRDRKLAEALKGCLARFAPGAADAGA
jgi:hypothetical protein